MKKLSGIEEHALDVLGRAFCELRYYSKRPLNDQGKEHLFHIADAAHNIPSALAGNEFFADRLENDVKTLEYLLDKRPNGGDRQFFASGRTITLSEEQITMILIGVVMVVIGLFAMAFNITALIAMFPYASLGYMFISIYLAVRQSTKVE